MRALRLFYYQRGIPDAALNMPGLISISRFVHPVPAPYTPEVGALPDKLFIVELVKWATRSSDR